MSAAQRQTATLRDEYAAMTRQRIIAAFVETLEDEAGDDTSMAAVARRAGIAERTIYRHFKGRAELMDAAGEWIEHNVFGYVPFSRPDELPAVFRELCQRYDRRPQLARALALTRAGRSLRAQFRRRLVQQHRKAMAPLVRHLPAKQARQAEALAAYLNNTQAWNTLREDFGLSSGEIADAIEWATTTLLKDVRKRDAAAARQSGPASAEAPSRKRRTDKPKAS
ncbi:putative transcriptional regulatory protein, TetR family [Bradyrhizobium sp. ORS 278]|uniref:TetR/AcrR family transcriptional regulator n=1 Tax=Bradyrhizobium sp. (strain ORS 278) TaxID=114615 RepID=UPI0001507A7F|nr:TetR/AcrR family transcriptional regulator [Bradyrhizobium sp. ORS 278]CAL76284.1 putative transcriptional regulatory protein, TetR family [Bradyrhizobium sp. ORS 278]